MMKIDFQTNTELFHVSVYLKIKKAKAKRFV